MNKSIRRRVEALEAGQPAHGGTDWYTPLAAFYPDYEGPLLVKREAGKARTLADFYRDIVEVANESD